MATLICGRGPNDSTIEVAVDADGKLIISGDITIGDIAIDNVEISNDEGNPVPITGALTDTQLRASDVKVTLDSEAVVLGAGSATIGKLGANSGVDIGDVDVTSLPAHLGTVASNVVRVGVEFTRPSDTTAYAAKDVVCNSTSSPAVITFANFSRVNQGSGIIVRARLMTDKKDVTSAFRLHLFHTQPTAINDNSPYLMVYGNAANRIGMVDFPAMSTEDPANSTAAATMRPSSDGAFGVPNLWFQADAASRAIYGILETVTGFTPASGQKFYVELAAILD